MHCGSCQIFIGEYASDQGTPTNDMESALGDAAWLLGLGNSDLVTMSSYAPLWANVNGLQWVPDLIGFNNTSVYGSPSYYAQVILSQNHGTTVVSDSVGNSGAIRPWSPMAQAVPGGHRHPGALDGDGLNPIARGTVQPARTLISLSAPASTSTNSITNPTAIVPVTTSISGIGSTFTETFAGYSITILKFTADTAPSVAHPAAVNPSPVTGTTANLSVLGADNAGRRR